MDNGIRGQYNTQNRILLRVCINFLTTLGQDTAYQLRDIPCLFLPILQILPSPFTILSSLIMVLIWGIRTLHIHLLFRNISPKTESNIAQHVGACWHITSFLISQLNISLSALYRIVTIPISYSERPSIQAQFYSIIHAIFLKRLDPFGVKSTIASTRIQLYSITQILLHYTPLEFDPTLSRTAEGEPRCTTTLLVSL